MPAAMDTNVKRLPTAPQRKRLGSRVLLGCVAGLACALGAESWHVLFGTNLHVIVPGLAYRCAQPTRADVEHMVDKYGIKTIINLRGCCSELDWYMEESRATRDCDIAQEDINLSAGRLPSATELRQLVDALDHAEYPILVHCRRGSDRTGMVSTIVQLLKTDVSLSEARKQLDPRFGHLAIGRMANLDWFLNLYEEWLGQTGQVHSRSVFREWITNQYCPGECRCRFELLEAPGEVRVGKPFLVRIRAHNTSVRTWRFRPCATAGIHACYTLVDGSNRLVTQGQAGLFEALVAPGESIDLSLPVAPQYLAGAYTLKVDLGDGQHCAFFQAGDEPLFVPVTVR
jgi:protein tyrosine phosphatase (PTP) superfamily phosphohydrolase (DUF442 family)